MTIPSLFFKITVFTLNNVWDESSYGIQKEVGRGRGRTIQDFQLFDWPFDEICRYIAVARLAIVIGDIFHCKSHNCHLSQIFCGWNGYSHNCQSVTFSAILPSASVYVLNPVACRCRPASNRVAGKRLDNKSQKQGLVKNIQFFAEFSVSGRLRLRVGIRLRETHLFTCSAIHYKFTKPLAQPLH